MGLLKKINVNWKSKKSSARKKPVRSLRLGQIKKMNGLSGRVDNSSWVKTGISGFDGLLGKGIPQGSSILLAGGAGSGKTIFSLETIYHAAKNNEKCLYISLEESEERLRKHMRDFGWNCSDLEKRGLLKIKRVYPFKISRSVEALLSKARGELNINLEHIEELIPKGFKPKWIIVDSLTALAAAFKDDETSSYRLYIEQLFRYFEKLGATSLFISETEQIPLKYSNSGAEEFLADGVVAFYAVRHGNIRENAIEIIKLRGATHKKKIVAMQIVEGEGIVVYPEQEIFSNIEVNK